jgi:hypothetical protein
MNLKRSRFRQVGHTRELSGPACALKDPAAIEVLRLWILDETPVCVFRLGQDPGRSWGFLLADVARTIGKAALDTKGTDSRDTVALLRVVFNSVLEEPAAVPAGTFAVLPLQDGENVETINEDVDPARNHERASSAGQTLEFYSRLVNEDMSAGFWPAIVDLMADIGHFCDEHDLDFHDLKAMASEHHQIESGRIYDGPTDSSTLEDSARTNCVLCNQSLVEDGDNWCDLCPGCADHVSEYMDEQDLHGRIGRAKAISHMSRQ